MKARDTEVYERNKPIEIEESVLIMVPKIIQ